VARERFLKDKCGRRAKKFEHRCPTFIPDKQKRYIASLHLFCSWLTFSSTTCRGWSIC